MHVRKEIAGRFLQFSLFVVFLFVAGNSSVWGVHWRVPNPPGANPLVAEGAFPTSDYWGLTGVARCAEEMTGICRDFQYAADPLPHQTAKTSKGPFQLPGG